MYLYETAGDNYNLLKEFVVYHRKHLTEAESILWEHLKANQLGTKFRRQHIIGNYIADFINLHYGFIIEVDGGYHLIDQQIVKDEQRTEDLEKKGFEVLRFSNEEVIGNLEQTLNTIKQKIMEKSNKTNISGAPLLPEGLGEAWAVDAACSGNPGQMEYQGIDLATGEQVFHFGPVFGTNNIGEFLAIVHALALMEQRGITDKVIYSDSFTAMTWVNKKHCKTKLENTPKTEKVLELVRRAERWLLTHPVRVPIIQWETKLWGEIPADFGRKK